MYRKFLAALAVTALLGGGLTITACSTAPNTVEQVQNTARNTQAVAELAFTAALKAIDVKVKDGTLKGAQATAVSKALTTAKKALDISRVAVAVGTSDAASLAANALQAIAAVTKLLQ